MSRLPSSNDRVIVVRTSVSKRSQVQGEDSSRVHYVHYHGRRRSLREPACKVFRRRRARCSSGVRDCTPVRVLEITIGCWVPCLQLQPYRSRWHLLRQQTTSRKRLCSAISNVFRPLTQRGRCPRPSCCLPRQSRIPIGDAAANASNNREI